MKYTVYWQDKKNQGSWHTKWKHCLRASKMKEQIHYTVWADSVQRGRESKGLFTWAVLAVPNAALMVIKPLFKRCNGTPHILLSRLRTRNEVNHSLRITVTSKINIQLSTAFIKLTTLFNIFTNLTSWLTTFPHSLIIIYPFNLRAYYLFHL